MKHIFSILLAIVIAAMPMAARDRISRNVSDLPTQAQTLLKSYFANETVNRIKIDSGAFGHKDYEVVLSNGTEIEFNKEGAWTEIDCGRQQVPSGLILKNIRDYVSKNFPNQKIVKIDNKSHKYELELSNGLDLEFNRDGSFLRVDD